ncbi:MAG: C25 family cysteine peptidase, partial [Bacteroidota bacterium]
MHHKLFTLFCLLSSLGLAAQERIQATIEWASEPKTVEWAGVRRIDFGFRQQDVGAAAGAMNFHPKPHYQRTFSARAGRQYDVQVIRTDFEPVSVPRGTEELPTEFGFTVTVSQQPGGEYLGKLSAPALIRTTTGVQRLTGFDIRLVPKAGHARPRMTFATSSVLREGTWFRIEVENTGIHKMSRDFLTEQVGVNLDGVDPRNIALYGQGGSGKLPETTNNLPPDDLTELPIRITGEDDGNFDGGDFVLFYAHGPDAWRYDGDQDRFFYEKNIYSTTNTYFLRVGGARGSRVGNLPTAGGGTGTDSYDAVYHFQEDRFNVLHELGGNSHGSGQDWFGDFIRDGQEKNYPALFRVPDPVPGERATVRARMALRANATSRFFLTVNDQELQSSSASRITFGAQEQSNAFSVANLDGGVDLNVGGVVNFLLSYPQPAGASQNEGYLDWIQLRARRQLRFSGLEQFPFRDTRTRDVAAVTFNFGDLPSDAEVWRIDGADIRAASFNGNGFSAPGGQAFEYVAFRSGAGLLTPTGGRAVDNQNLHGITGAEMIIVTHPNFLTQAEQLAEHRRQHNGLNVVLVTTDQVYNEFSSGRDDAAAIRNFAWMLHERGAGLRHLLLFGDGSFDHRNVLELGTTFLPVYEHTGRPTEVKSFPADDFFGIFGPASNGQPLEPDLNINVGRLPVKTSDEAVQIVAKLIRYDSNPSALGDWRTRMTFVGDDEDGGIHTTDVDRVASAVQVRKPDLN